MRILSLQPYIKPLGQTLPSTQFYKLGRLRQVSYEKITVNLSFEPRPTNFHRLWEPRAMLGLSWGLWYSQGGTGYNPKNKNNPTIFLSDIAAKRPQRLLTTVSRPSAGAMALTRTYLQLNPEAILTAHLLHRCTFTRHKISSSSTLNRQHPGS